MPTAQVQAVAPAVPFLNDKSLNTAIGDSVQDYINIVCNPNTSQKPTYGANGFPTQLIMYDGAVQTTPYRRIQIDLTYDGNELPTTEEWKLYDENDGTTILKTVTFTYTWVSYQLTNQTMVVT